jgi:ferredoxin-like protein FixX
VGTYQKKKYHLVMELNEGCLICAICKVICLLRISKLKK